MQRSSVSAVFEWIAVNAPRTAQLALVGATEAEIDACERKSGQAWTEDMRALYQASNGWVHDPDNGTSLIASYPFFSLDELSNERQQHLAVRGYRKPDLAGVRLFSGYTREELRDRVEQPPQSYDPKTGETTQMSEQAWLGLSSSLTGEARVKERERLLEKEYARAGEQLARLNRGRPPRQQRPNLGSAGSPSSLYWPHFIPIAGLDGYDLVVDLRPGAQRGCVCRWDNVEGLERATWRSLGGCFDALLFSLENATEFMDAIPRIVNGSLIWDAVAELPD